MPQPEYRTTNPGTLQNRKTIYGAVAIITIMLMAWAALQWPMQNAGAQQASRSPENAQAKQLSLDKIEFSWDPPTATDTVITKYNVTVEPTTDLNADIPGIQNSISVDGNTHQAISTLLMPNITYEFAVQAVSEHGESEWTIALVTVTESPREPPVNLAATQQDDEATAVITWTEPTYTGGTAITGYDASVTPSKGVRITYVTPPADGHSTAIIASNITPGVEYTYAIKPRNKWGTGPQATVKHGLPDAPDSLTATQTAPRTANITWTPPSKKGGAAISSYEVSIAGNTYEYEPTTIHLPATENEYQVGNLPAGIYQVQVRAETGRGIGPMRSAIADVSGKPTAPRNVTMMQQSDHQALITWEAPETDNGYEVTGYSVTYTTSDGTTVAPVTTGSNTLQHVYEGMQPRHTYNFQVRAMNSIGASPPGETVLTINTVPSRPRNLEVKQEGKGRITVHWDQPANNGGEQITKYQVSIVDPPEAAVISRTYSGYHAEVTGLAKNKEYTFLVQAINARGASQPGNINFTVAQYVYDAPPSLTAEQTGPDEATLRWEAPPWYPGGYGWPIIGYRIAMTPEEEAIFSPEMGEVARDTYADHITVRQLTPGVKYEFSVAAFNSFGDGNTARVALTISTPPNAAE